MKLTLEHHFKATVPEVARMLADEGFADFRAQASGSEQTDALVDGDADGPFTVSIRRVVPATMIPAEFRSFVGSTLDVKYTEVWEAPGKAERVGTFAVEITGAPGHVSGALELKDSNGGTDLFATGVVSAPVPIFGAMIANAVGEAVTAAFEKEFEAADEWLAQA